MHTRFLEQDAEGAAKRIVERLEGRTFQHAVATMEAVELSVITGRPVTTEDESSLARAIMGMAAGSALYAIRLARQEITKRRDAAHPELAAGEAA